MEVLSVLEKKIAGLIELIKELRTQNSELVLANSELLLAHAELTAGNAQLEHNSQVLKDQIEKLQASMLERPQELALTRAAVDDLIKNIDFLIEHEQEQ